MVKIMDVYRFAEKKLKKFKDPTKKIEFLTFVIDYLHALQQILNGLKEEIKDTKRGRHLVNQNDSNNVEEKTLCQI